MKKLEVLPLFVNTSHKFETIPDLPKSLIYQNSVLVYIQTSYSKITTINLAEPEIPSYILELVQKEPSYPCAVFKTSSETRLMMGFQDTLQIVTEHILSKIPFELQEYIISESASVQVIRVKIIGLNISARIFENICSFDSLECAEEKFILTEFNDSGSVIISSSTSRLKNKAMALYYLISASCPKNLVMASVSLDFIKNSDHWYFISAHSLNVASVMRENKSHGFFLSPHSVSSKNGRELFTEQSKRSKIKLAVPVQDAKHEEYRKEKVDKSRELPFAHRNEEKTSEKVENLINKLINKDKVRQIKHMSYKKWSQSKSNDLLCKLYSKKIVANKETVKKSYNQGLGSLKSLISSMGESVRNFQVHYNLTEYIKNEAGKFLLEKIQFSKSGAKHNKKPLKFTASDSISNAGNDIINYGSSQMDKLIHKCKAPLKLSFLFE